MSKYGSDQIFMQSRDARFHGRARRLEAMCRILVVHQQSVGCIVARFVYRSEARFPLHDDGN